MRIRTLLAVAIVLLGGLAAWFLQRAGPGVETAGGAAPAAPADSAAAPDGAVALPAQPDDASQRAQLSEAPAAAPAPAAASAVLEFLVVAREDGAPLAGVRVQLGPLEARSWSARPIEGSKGTLESALQTDASGRVEFTVPPAAYQVWAHLSKEPRSQGHEVLAAIAAGERREVRLELPTRPDVHFFGRVVAAQDETPIAAARIEVRNGRYFGEADTDWSHSEVAQTLTCDAEGRFDLWAPSWVQWECRADAQGHGPLLFQIAKGHDTPESAYTVRLPSAAGLEIALRSSAGVELAGLDAVVHAQGFEMVEATDYFSMSDEVWRSPFDAAGNASFADLPPRAALEISLRRAGKLVRQEAETMRLEPGELRKLEIVLGGGAAIRGLLADPEARPVAGAEIWLAAATAGAQAYLQPYFEPAARAKTDDAGAFRFDDVSEGTWSVGPAPSRDPHSKPSDQALAPHAQTVTIRAGDSIVDVRLVAYRGLYLRGRVLDPKDQPAPRLFVLAQALEEQAFLNAATRTDGTFTIGPLAPGSFSLQAGGSGSPFAQSAPVVAHAGDVDIVLHVTAGAAVNGTVVLPDGQGVPARVAVTPLDGGEAGVMMTSTQPDGSFSFTGLAPGRYTIVAATTEGQAGSEEFDGRVAGEPATVRVTVQPGARVRIRYLGPEDYGSFRLKVGKAIVWNDGIARGDSQTASVSAGEVSLELFALRSAYETGPEVQTLTLAVGETRDVEFGKAP